MLPDADVYGQHRAAFARVSAFALMLDGSHVANIALKHPSGAEGRVQAFVHVIGVRMIRAVGSPFGHARSALERAAPKLRLARYRHHARRRL